MKKLLILCNIILIILSIYFESCNQDDDNSKDMPDEEWLKSADQLSENLIFGGYLPWHAAKEVDGFSIGSNDLTQLVLGADRDNENIAAVFDERDPAVLKALGMIIKGAKRHGKYVGICGQAPSVYPEILEHLVRWGIDSVSVNPDVIEVSRKIVAQTEMKILLERKRE